MFLGLNVIMHAFVTDLIYGAAPMLMCLRMNDSGKLKELPAKGLAKVILI